MRMNHLLWKVDGRIEVKLVGKEFNYVSLNSHKLDKIYFFQSNSSLVVCKYKRTFSSIYYQSLKETFLLYRFSDPEIDIPF